MSTQKYTQTGGDGEILLDYTGGFIRPQASRLRRCPTTKHQNSCTNVCAENRQTVAYFRFPQSQPVQLLRTPQEAASPLHRFPKL